MESIEYGGWENCYRVGNNCIEAVVTADVGPRVIRLGVPGEINLFKEFPEMMGLKGGDEWRIYGGHRLWHAPEAKPRTYHPDNRPVHIEEIDNGLRAIQELETTTGIEKQMDISLYDDSSPCFEVVHRIKNHNLWTISLSVWALSVMAPGGVAVIPQPPYQPHEKVLTPSHPMVLWPYTTMDDERWDWGTKFILLRQDPDAEKPQKIGMALYSGKTYYSLEGFLFVKQYEHTSGAVYPDFGCSFEAFTNNEMLEMESLSPLCNLDPGDVVEHKEHWCLHKDVRLGETQEEIEGTISSLPDCGCCCD